MIITRFILETLTPLHCGGGDDPVFDQIVTRDAFGFWRIPGSSIAGILRNYLKKSAPELENVLFGYASTSSRESNKDNKASIVWCMDAYQLDFDMKLAYCKQLNGEKVSALGPFVRDHVNIDLNTSTAKEGGKYDEEIIPPGTRFFLELRLDGWEKDLTDDEKQAFIKLCSAVANGEVTFGGKKVSGYGRFSCNFKSGNPSFICMEYDLKKANELEAYLNIPKAPSLSLKDGTRISLEKNSPVYPAKDISFDLELPLETDGPVMVGGTNLKEQDQEVDMVCLTTPYLDYEGQQKINYCYTLPGSSFRGVLRHGVYKVAKALKLDAQKEVDELFGYINGKDKEKKAASGKVQIEDIYLKQARALRLQHVAIDRFTGGALDSALFDEKPVFASGLKIPLKLKVTGITKNQAKLLSHALLDLCTGMLPVGGGTNRGNGSLKITGLASGLEKALSASELKFTGAWDGQDISAFGFVDFLKKLD